MTVNGKPISADTTIRIGLVIAIIAALGGAWSSFGDVKQRLAIMERIGHDTGDDISAIRVSMEKISDVYGSRLLDLERRLTALEARVPK